MSGATELVRAALDLRRAVDGLAFGPPVSCVYNPLDYAWAPHRLYLERFGPGRKRVVFLGMNPGPWGMAQVGVPFGEVGFVRGWLGIEAPVGKPKREEPSRPVDGFDCTRSEVSGRRLWGLFAARFGTADAFFRDHFVCNYCPLVFMEEGGRNRTPDKLPAAEQQRLFAACDAHLKRVMSAVGPEWVIGVGAFAGGRAREALAGLPIRVGVVLHPSPASPAANRGWAGQATAQLRRLGVWEP